MVEEAATTTDNTDMTSVFVVGGSKGSILLYIPQNGHLQKVFQVSFLNSAL